MAGASISVIHFMAPGTPNSIPLVFGVGLSRWTRCGAEGSNSTLMFLYRSKASDRMRCGCREATLHRTLAVFRDAVDTTRSQDKHRSEFEGRSSRSIGVRASSDGLSVMASLVPRRRDDVPA